MKFERVYDLARAGRTWWFTLLLGAAVWGTWSTARLELDMSFRPLFQDDPAARARTRAFEADFGPGSGAHIGVILAGVQDVDDELVRAVAELEHVAEAHTVAARDTPAVALLARLDLPLEDLAGRTPVIHAFRELVRSRAPPAVPLHFVGVSVVEEAYARIVLRSLVTSVALSTLVILGLLVMVFGQWRLAAIATAGLALAMPVTLGAMAARGQALTVVSSMVATLVLVIGVADAVHMIAAFRHERARGAPAEAAARAMLGETGLACLMTTMTTVAGFLSLQAASLPAIRDFGGAVAVGVVGVYVANQLLLPNLLVLFATAERGATRAERWLERLRGAVRRRVIAGPGTVVLLTAGVFTIGIAGLARLESQQRFNEEVAPAHPVRVSQAEFERHFGGFLGPELELRRTDAAAVAEEDSRELLGAIRRLEPVSDARLLGVVDGRAGIAVRVGDIGTKRAAQLVEELEDVTRRQLGAGYELEVVGPWWSAQCGMTNLIRDMVVSFVVAALLVLPCLALVVRSPRLFLIGVLPNVLPLAFVLGFMGWCGMTLRIGTAMILAIALGIAVDDTIHLVLRLRRERARGVSPEEVVERTLDHTGHAVLVTSLILAGGFSSMATSDLFAIRDMGIVGAVAMLAALAADVLLAPALFLLGSRPLRYRAGYRGGITPRRALPARADTPACRTPLASRSSSESGSS